MEAWLQQIKKRLAQYLDQTVSSRATQTSVDVVDAIVDGMDTKIGLPNPAVAGTDTLFKYLKKLDGTPASPIKSIQRGYYSYTTNGNEGERFATVTISAVTMAKAMVHVYNHVSISAGSYTSGVSGRLTSDTQLQLAYWTGSSTGYIRVMWEVIEFV